MVDHRGLRWFLPEEVLSRDLLRHSVSPAETRSTTAVWALLADEDVGARGGRADGPELLAAGAQAELDGAAGQMDDR
jgi:hypothetical protein